MYRNWESGRFKYVGVQDSSLKLYPVAPFLDDNTVAMIKHLSQAQATLLKALSQLQESRPCPDQRRVIKLPLPKPQGFETSRKLPTNISD